MRYFVVIPAAGSGRRFSASVPKQYAALGSSTVIEHALERVRVGPGLRRHRGRGRGRRCVVAGHRGAPFAAHRNRRRWRASARTRCAMRCVRSPRGFARRLDHGSRRGPAVLRRPRTCSCSSANWPSHPVGGLLAVPLADTLKRALEPGAHVDACRVHHRPRRALARRDSAGVSLRRVVARDRSGARCGQDAHGRSAGHRMERPAAACSSPAARTTSR